MNARPEFDPEVKCPKCGHGEVRVSYFEDASKYSCIAHRDRSVSYADDEHLHRHCARCHYEWAEAVIATAPRLLPSLEETP